MKKEMPIDQFILWVYQDQNAAEVIDRGVGMLPAEMMADGRMPIAVSADGCYQVEQNALLGTRVDYSGRGTAKLHPDAELCHDTVLSRAVTPLQRGIILEYGKSGLEPEWQSAEAGMVPILSKTGKLKYIKDENRKVRGCAVAPTAPAGHKEFKRECYQHWYDALEQFRIVLMDKGMLVDYDLLPPSMPRAPWIKKDVDVVQNI